MWRHRAATRLPTALVAPQAYLVDDLNMPQLDTYEMQSAIALMRQHFDYEHWFDRGKFTQKNVHDVLFVSNKPDCWVVGGQPAAAALGHGLLGRAAGRREPLNYLQHLPRRPPQGRLPGGGAEAELEPVRAAINLHSQVAATFRKTAVNCHYESASGTWPGSSTACSAPGRSSSRTRTRWSGSSCTSPSGPTATCSSRTSTSASTSSWRRRSRRRTSRPSASTGSSYATGPTR
eukprot:SAG22_NODE_328_length_12271_cov_9.681811_3_plen_233_part_00